MRQAHGDCAVYVSELPVEFMHLPALVVKVGRGGEHVVEAYSRKALFTGVNGRIDNYLIFNHEEVSNLGIVDDMQPRQVQPFLRQPEQRKAWRKFLLVRAVSVGRLSLHGKTLLRCNSIAAVPFDMRADRFISWTPIVVRKLSNPS